MAADTVSTIQMLHAESSESDDSLADLRWSNGLNNSELNSSVKSFKSVGSIYTFVVEATGEYQEPRKEPDTWQDTFTFATCKVDEYLKQCAAPDLLDGVKGIDAPCPTRGIANEWLVSPTVQASKIAETPTATVAAQSAPFKLSLERKQEEPIKSATFTKPANLPSLSQCDVTPLPETREATPAVNSADGVEPFPVVAVLPKQKALAIQARDSNVLDVSTGHVANTVAAPKVVATSVAAVSGTAHLLATPNNARDILAEAVVPPVNRLQAQKPTLELAANASVKPIEARATNLVDFSKYDSATRLPSRATVTQARVHSLKPADLEATEPAKRAPLPEINAQARAAPMRPSSAPRPSRDAGVGNGKPVDRTFARPSTPVRRGTKDSVNSQTTTVPKPFHFATESRARPSILLPTDELLVRAAKAQWQKEKPTHLPRQILDHAPPKRSPSVPRRPEQVCKPFNLESAHRHVRAQEDIQKRAEMLLQDMTRVTFTARPLSKQIYGTSSLLANRVPPGSAPVSPRVAPSEPPASPREPRRSESARRATVSPFKARPMPNPPPFKPDLPHHCTETQEFRLSRSPWQSPRKLAQTGQMTLLEKLLSGKRTGNMLPSSPPPTSPRCGPSDMDTDNESLLIVTPRYRSAILTRADSHMLHTGSGKAWDGVERVDRSGLAPRTQRLTIEENAAGTCPPSTYKVVGCSTSSPQAAMYTVGAAYQAGGYAAGRVSCT